ncbi:hypothetical protein TVAG_210160 [Trichomonas vaginalis G3]|uniref:GP63-like n=1 Tax=Trichomonas vaginalis (strain ATCC PRA-98 / G3) TaxID=412133 RepID=A2DVS3_TRIV3|nr:hypothetical protein TVAG_210160 [Trichomonas vaginalis G3]|eukprot:XP_001327709.1 hypothetical protein [Trichomonas vaginalis G3]
MFSKITSQDQVTHRPLTGILVLDQEYFDDFQNGFSTPTFNNYYYQKFLALTFRIMGIDNTVFDQYHPYNSNEPYDSNGNTCTVTNQYNKTFKYLKTPFSQIFFANHYRSERANHDHSDCYGIELDDFSERDDFLDATQSFSSPASRVYYSDINAYANFYIIASDRIRASLNKRITDVTTAMLRDSGFYKINISKAYPLIWGNPETGVAFDDFSTGSPRSWPPDLYYITSNSQSPLVPSFDFKMRLLSINLPSSIPTCPRNESTSFCYAQQWYQGPLKDGMNIDLYNLAFDYIGCPKVCLAQT